MGSVRSAFCLSTLNVIGEKSVRLWVCTRWKNTSMAALMSTAGKASQARIENGRL